MKDEVLSSPIRWAGSKKRVLNDMLESFKRDKENYIEPFLGSGVVMINVLNNNVDTLHYKNIYVNDINSNIIDFYKMLKSKPKNLINDLLELSDMYNSKDNEDKEKMYYEIRDRFNNCEENKSVYFYFLMKVGFNGVYRENKSGKFNVPFGRKEKFIVQEDSLLRISKLIKNVHFYNLSYEKFLDKLSKKEILKDSFMYCDPPYIPDDKLVSQKQELYTSGNFNHYDFVEKLKSFSQSNIIISMSESTKAKKIYGKSFITKNLTDIIRTINPQKLFKSKEILFLNYDENE
ncbi:MAG: Dam family site-specific DNA-(adenine-N6)-methyltransferase [Bacilli bacterium]|nr:Dam family site-specific DNA-(adenine-N6)-methyltransferase [Bacilli bacterium]